MPNKREEAEKVIPDLEKLKEQLINCETHFETDQIEAILSLLTPYIQAKESEAIKTATEAYESTCSALIEKAKAEHQTQLRELLKPLTDEKIKMSLKEYGAEYWMPFPEDYFEGNFKELRASFSSYY